jgi:hypothetical protein
MRTGRRVLAADHPVHLDRAIVDWHDGAIGGLLTFTSFDSAWRFSLFAERRSMDDVDDRLYLLTQVPDSLFSRLWDVVTGSGKPSTRLVVPSWEFASADEEEAAEQILSAIAESPTVPRLLIRAHSLEAVDGIWGLAASPPVART